MSFSFETPKRGKRSALVTGASGGIGLAISRALAADGFQVTMTARRSGKLEDAVEQLVNQGLDVAGVAGDLSDPGFAFEVVNAHGRHSDRIDVLVNNAGVGVGQPVGELGDRQIELQYGVNLRPVFELYRESLVLLRRAARDDGALVVNIASLGGKRPEPIVSVYSAMKAAVIAFSAAMNKELGPDGIKSTAICPAFTDTEMSRWVQSRVPKEDMISVEDVAATVRWLISLTPQCVVPEVELSRPGNVL